MRGAGDRLAVSERAARGAGLEQSPVTRLGTLEAKPRGDKKNPWH